ncbi:MAG: DUF2723 domain-containing protein [Candidatus Dadabacteria bacterium]|nr:MAG: DUF2723 domain-containing protein [Candidatus Dadabacteria bacterium]
MRTIPISSILRFSAIIWALSWLLLSYCTAPSLYWGDSGEFILSASNLDIAHPAGFPLFSQLANFFSHIPYGSIAFRVNLFSTFIGSLAIAGAYGISFALLLELLSLSLIEAAIVSLVTPIVLLSSPFFLKECLVAEVYTLNLLLLECFTFLFIRWFCHKDRKALMYIAFLSGLALGNHISFALAILGVLPLGIFRFEELKGQWASIFILFTVGLAVYGYVPVRSFANPPLNTGSPATLKRFFNFVTDQRDLKIKSDGISGAAEDKPPIFQIFGKRVLLSLRNGVSHIVDETAPSVLVVGIIGLILLLRWSPSLFYLLVSIAVGNYIFFLGWFPDSWLYPLALAGVGASLFFGFIVSIARRIKAPFRSFALKLCPVFVVLSFLLLYKPEVVDELSDFKEYLEARRDAKNTLEGVPSYSLFVVEPSWFSVAYMVYGEGFRSDITPIYLPSLFFPRYFRPLTLKDEGGALFNAGSVGKGLSDETADLKLLGRLIDWASLRTVVSLEPLLSINWYLHGVLRGNDKGGLFLKRGELKTISSGYVQKKTSEVVRLYSHLKEVPDPIKAELAIRLETKAVMLSSLLWETGFKREAISLLRGICKGGYVKGLKCPDNIKDNISLLQKLL